MFYIVECISQTIKVVDYFHCSPGNRPNCSGSLWLLPGTGLNMCRTNLPKDSVWWTPYFKYFFEGVLEIMRKNILSRLAFTLIMNTLSQKMTTIEEPFFPGCDAVSLGKWFLLFWRIVDPQNDLERLSRWHSITSQKNGLLIHTVLEIPKLTWQNLLLTIRCQLFKYPGA